MNSRETQETYKSFKYANNPSFRQSELTAFSFLKFAHRIMDSLNISLLILIFLYTFLSIRSQSQWTNLYALISHLRNININLIDYVATIEQTYVKQFEDMEILKKTSSKDLIYLVKPQIQEGNNSYFKDFISGISASQYQRGF